MKNALIFVGIGALILAGGWWFLAAQKQQTTNEMPQAEIEIRTPSQGEKPIIEEQGVVIGDENLVTFTCDGGKTITAVFERDIVGVTLSDGRQITLRQTESGSGIRYLSNDSAIEFRGQGNVGSLIENGRTTYSNCNTSN